MDHEKERPLRKSTGPVWVKISACVFLGFLIVIFLSFSISPIASQFSTTSDSPLSTPPGNHELNALIGIEPPLIKTSGTVSVSYGPFEVSPKAMMPEATLHPIAKPCNGDCTITAMRSMLINASSTDKRTLAPSTGVHLHHIIFFNNGIPDLVCPQYGERFFGGGNEMWTRRWNTSGDYGYWVRNHEWSAIVEVMNESEWQGGVEIEVLFEIERVKPMKRVRPVWLDVTGCGNASIAVKDTKEAFSYRTPEWTSSINGTILDMAGHQHDGGVDMTFGLNEKTVCRSVQLYDTQNTGHITAAGVCKDGGHVKIGDRLVAEARYDPQLHPLIMHQGKPDPVMGSMGVYIGIDS